jgi:hypothetical protein
MGTLDPSLHNCPSCGKFFGTNAKLVEHFARHRPDQQRAALTALSGSGESSGPQLEPVVARPIAQKDRLLQFQAILGDLEHKLSVYNYFSDFSPEIALLFDNRFQAAYIQDLYPSLLPPGAPNAHHVGTVFEAHYSAADRVFSSAFVYWLSRTFQEKEHPTPVSLSDALPSYKKWMQ